MSGLVVVAKIHAEVCYPVTDMKGEHTDFGAGELTEMSRGAVADFACESRNCTGFWDGVLGGLVSSVRLSEDWGSSQALSGAKPTGKGKSHDLDGLPGCSAANSLLSVVLQFLGRQSSLLGNRRQARQKSV